MSSDSSLPAFIPPMLAQLRQPFDSDKHLFEIKWDGTRALAFIEQDGYRLINRRHNDITARYPEFECLRNLPAGTILDGEVVVLRDGKPDFELLMSRDRASAPRRIKAAAASMPATYIVFDQLYAGYESQMDQPLTERRARLADCLAASGEQSFVFSQGIVGDGKALFQEVARQELEGIVAKRLDSRYISGRRNKAWTKIKRNSRMLCAIIGFIPEGKAGFHSLALAADDGGSLTYVGRVGTGITMQLRDELNALLWPRVVPEPLVRCRLKAHWVDDGLYCWVRYLERTSGGELRAPVCPCLPPSLGPDSRTAPSAGAADAGS